MATLWPWLVMAGLGALHGLHPATGWMFAAAWGVRSRDRTQVLRALIPIAVGHAAAVGLVAGAVVFGRALDRGTAQAIAAVLIVAVAIVHLSRRERRSSAPTGHAALGLWSFLMSSVHGAGLMLVPALMPLCLAGDSSSALDASGSLLRAFAAVVVHTVAMIAVTGLVAGSFCRGIDAVAAWWRRRPGGCAG